MRRCLFNLAAAVSLVFLLAILALSLTAFIKHDVNIAKFGKRGVEVYSNGWLIAAILYRDFPTTTPLTVKFTVGEISPRYDFDPKHYVYQEDLWNGAWSALGIHVFDFTTHFLQRTGANDAYVKGRSIVVPAWLAFTCSAALPIVWIVVNLRKKRQRPGTCPACGYDLRATPEKSGPLFDRCPECGAVPASSVVHDPAMKRSGGATR